MNNDKKWYEEIPEQGVLCYTPQSMITNIIVITSDMKGWNGHSDFFNVDDLTPLTAEEIWQFMPWQSMNSAPEHESIMVMSKNKKLSITTLFLGRKSSDYKKWLPLPKVEK